MSDLIEQLLLAAVIEARSVPRLLERDGDIYWRGREGQMVRLTACASHLACEWSTT